MRRTRSPFWETTVRIETITGRARRLGAAATPIEVHAQPSLL